MRVFDKSWFENNQKWLVPLANTFIGKRILCIHGDRSSVGNKKIVKVTPNCIHWDNGDGTFCAEARIGNKFSNRMYYALYPLWYVAHTLDSVFNRLHIRFNFGFDTFYPQPNCLNTPNAYPSTAADDSTVGTIAWSDVDNIKTDNASNATAVMSGTGVTHYIKATNFGFAIPTGNDILGAYFIIKDYYYSGGTTGNITDSSVKLVLADGSLGSTDKAKVSNWPASAGSTSGYGGPEDTWGESLTEAIVEDADFGIAISVVGTAGCDRTANIDVVYGSIHYRPTGANTCVRTIGNTGSDYNTVRSATDGTTLSTVNGTYGFVRTTTSAGTYAIDRAIATFDTSSLGDDITISSAVLSLMGAISKTDGDSTNVGIVSSNPADAANITTADYDTLGTTAYATAINIADWSTSTFNDYTLNATGEAAISLTGITKMGVRIGLDISGDAPSGGNIIYFSNPNITGTAKDPKLVVLYSAEYTKTFDEVVNTSETYSRGVTFHPTYNEVVNTSETYSAGKVFARIFNEVINISESIAKLRGYNKTLSDTVNASESLTRQSGYSRILSDEVTASETIAKGTTRSVSEAVNTSETYARTVAFHPTFNENVSVTEKLRRYLNGLEIIWSDIAKAVTSWTDASGATTTWHDQTNLTIDTESGVAITTEDSVELKEESNSTNWTDQ